MFGRMMVEPVVQVDPGVGLQVAVAALIKVAENVDIVRWIELPASVLLFLVVPGDPESGAVYVLDRKKGRWAPPPEPYRAQEAFDPYEGTLGQAEEG